MTRAEIKYIAGKHYKKLQKYSREIARDFDEEAIHQFRVEYKKLRAFLRLLRLTPEVSRELKIPRKLKNLYEQAGVLRDLQLQQVRVREEARSEIKKPAEYYFLLHKKTEKQKARVRKCFNTDLVRNCREKLNSSLPDDCTLPTRELYKEDKLQSIRSIIGMNLFLDNDLHTIRKILKDLFYNARIYQEDENKDDMEKKQHQDLDELLDALGSYQDKCTAISLINHRWLQQLTEQSRQQPLRIQEKWLKEKQSMKQVLKEKLIQEFAPGDFIANRPPVNPAGLPPIDDQEH